MKASVKRMKRPSRQFSIAVGESLTMHFWQRARAVLNAKFNNRSVSGV